MIMNTRTAVRQRYPDLNKPLKIIRDHQEYAQFELGPIDPNQGATNSIITLQRAQELASESAKIIDALKGKKSVTIPQTEKIPKQHKTVEDCTKVYNIRY